MILHKNGRKNVSILGEHYTEGLAGEGDTCGQGGQFLEVRVHEIDPMEEAGGGPENNLVPWPGWWAEPYPGIN